MHRVVAAAVREIDGASGAAITLLDHGRISSPAHSDDTARRVGLAQDVWLRYLSLGGNGSLADVERYLAHNWCPDDHEHNLVAHAITEAFIEQGVDFPVAYRSPSGPGPAG